MAQHVAFPPPFRVILNIFHDAYEHYLNKHCNITSCSTAIKRRGLPSEAAPSILQRIYFQHPDIAHPIQSNIRMRIMLGKSLALRFMTLF
jgi:hypothetical protein